MAQQFAMGGLGDIFLSVKGAKSGVIKGESQDAAHGKEIDVVAWSWGMAARPSLGGGGATGKATLRELKIVKRVDKASTALMKALRTNEEIKEAILTVRKVGKNPLEYLTIKIEGGRIIALDIDTGESPANPVLIERVSFSFNKISIVYTPQGPDGNPLGKTVFEDEWTPVG